MTYDRALFVPRTSIVGAKITHDLDFDGTGGCTFLRVLLSLIIHDYPQLVVGALKLLLKHFSQRQEVLHAFKQAS
jgi:inositol 1,4,5-triphosphate receptor type 1